MKPVIRKSELAAALGISRPRISQFLQYGMPQRSDGRLGVQECCWWIIDNILEDQWVEGDARAVKAARALLHAEKYPV